MNVHALVSRFESEWNNSSRDIPLSRFICRRMAEAMSECINDLIPKWFEADRSTSEMLLHIEFPHCSTVEEAIVYAFLDMAKNSMLDDRLSAAVTRIEKTVH